MYDHELKDDEKRELLRIARASLRELVATGRLPPGAPHRQSMLAPATVDVEVRLGEQVWRGGHADGLPLFRAIQSALGQAVSGKDLPRGDALKPAVITVTVQSSRGPVSFDETSHPPPPPVFLR